MSKVLNHAKTIKNIDKFMIDRIKNEDFVVLRQKNNNMPLGVSYTEDGLK